MLSRKRDNELNRINKQLERVAKSLGTASALYQALASVVIMALPNELIKRKGNVVQVARDERADQITWQRMLAITSFFSTHTLAEEKAKLRQIIKERENLKHVSQKKFKEMAGRIYEFTTHINDVINYLYKWAHADGSPYQADAERGINIISGKGRKTYGQLAEVTQIAIDIAEDAYANGEELTPPQSRRFYNDKNFIQPWTQGAQSSTLLSNVHDRFKN